VAVVQCPSVASVAEGSDEHRRIREASDRRLPLGRADGDIERRVTRPWRDAGGEDQRRGFATPRQNALSPRSARATTTQLTRLPRSGFVQGLGFGTHGTGQLCSLPPLWTPYSPAKSSQEVGRIFLQRATDGISLRGVEGITMLEGSGTLVSTNGRFGARSVMIKGKAAVRCGPILLLVAALLPRGDSALFVPLFHALHPPTRGGGHDESVRLSKHTLASGLAPPCPFRDLAASISIAEATRHFEVRKQCLTSIEGQANGLLRRV
jgi:hypothetical protein